MLLSGEYHRIIVYVQFQFMSNANATKVMRHVFKAAVIVKNTVFIGAVFERT